METLIGGFRMRLPLMGSNGFLQKRGPESMKILFSRPRAMGKRDLADLDGHPSLQRRP